MRHMHLAFCRAVIEFWITCSLDCYTCNKHVTLWVKCINKRQYLSFILIRIRCHRLWPLMTALYCQYWFWSILLFGGILIAVAIVIWDESLMLLGWWEAWHPVYIYWNKWGLLSSLYNYCFVCAILFLRWLPVVLWSYAHWGQKLIK